MIRIVCDSQGEAFDLERMLNAWDWGGRFGDLHWRVDKETIHVWGYNEQFEDDLIEEIKEDSPEHRVFVKRYVEV